MSVGRRPIPSDLTEAGPGSIFVPTFTNRWHLSSSLACSVTSLLWSNFTSAATSAMNTGFSMATSEIRLINSGESMTFCTVCGAKSSKAADGRLWTASWLALSASSSNQIIASLTFTNMPVTALQTRIFRSLGEWLKLSQRSPVALWRRPDRRVRERMHRAFVCLL